MDTPAIWKRPDLQISQPFDSIFFDVDGVLIQTLHSFRTTDIAVAAYVVGTLHGLDWGQYAGITLEDVNLFKRAGGYNNDWDMCYLLASLFTARLREWKGTLLAERTTAEWAEIEREAHVEGHGGRAWVDAMIPASARLDYRMIGDLYHEYYWGAEELRKRFGREPRYLSEAKGLVHNEKMLYAPDFPRRLRAAGIRHLGMITGRVGPEVDSALERMEAYSGERWWDVIIPADICPKPDPRALRLAIEQVGAGDGPDLYIGDTADDHDLVLNYRATRAEGEPNVLVAMLVPEEEAELYQERGADFIVGSVEDLLWCWPEGMS